MIEAIYEEDLRRILTNIDTGIDEGALVKYYPGSCMAIFVKDKEGKFSFPPIMNVPPVSKDIADIDDYLDEINLAWIYFKEDERIFKNFGEGSFTGYIDSHDKQIHEGDLLHISDIVDGIDYIGIVDKTMEGYGVIPTIDMLKYGVEFQRISLDSLRRSQREVTRSVDKSLQMSLDKKANRKKAE